MRRLLSIVVRLILVIVVLVAVALVALRGWAVMRETDDPQEAVGATAKFASASGLKMHYREWGPGEGRVLLAIPGALAWSQTWHDIAEPLGQAGYRVIALDLPPFGYSERPSDRNFSRAALAGLILAFADDLDLERFTLVGHSFGGGATIEAAMRAPERVEALVLLDVALGLQAAPGRNILLDNALAFEPLRTALASATFANPLFTGTGLRGFIYDDAIVTDERIALYRAPLSVRGTSEAIGDWLLTGLFGDQSAAQSADRASYRKLDIPALVIWGREDTVTPLSQGEDLAGLLPRADLVVLEGVDHIPHVEAPAAVVEATDEFLQKLAGQVTAPGKQDRIELNASP